MDTIALIITLIIIFVVAGGLVYFVRDYIQYKNQVNKQFSVTQSSVNAEKADRVSNLKYVVDQINTVNTDIYSTTSDTVSAQDSLSLDLTTNNNNIVNSLNKMFSFNDGSGNNIQFMNLPGSTQPNIQLLNKVNATMGLTAKNLQPLENNVQFCSKNRPERCITFPDKDGNTLLTNLGNTGGKIILDAEGGVQMNNTVNFVSSDGKPSGSINNGPDSMVLQSKKFGIGGPGFSAPRSTLHVSATSDTDNVFEISNATSSLLQVTPNGNIKIYSKTNPNILVAELKSSQNGILEITATNGVKINGNLEVSGITTANVVSK
jgi:hypothetical protein